MLRKIKSLYSDTAANMASILAISMVPITFAAGAAMDYSRLGNQKSNAQAAIDAATLAGGKELNTKSDSELKVYVQDYIKANMDPKDYAEIKKLKFKIDRDKGILRVTADAKMRTALMGLAGYSELKYEIVSAIATGNGGIELALVLDNTNSMNADGKLAALKVAAEDFVRTMMKSNSVEDKAKVAIVPFAQYVNVGLDNRNASWIDVPDDSTGDEICYERKDVISKSGCSTKTGYNDGVPYEYESCSSYEYGEPYNYCYSPKTTWNGCVGSRKVPLNTRDSGYGTRVPGVMNVSCPARVTELTTSQSDLITEIKSMVGTGETYIPTGLVWGWGMLSEKAPFTQGVSNLEATSQKITKAIILMTDGENSKSAQLPSSPYHGGTDVDQANSWTTEVCDNIKADGMVIYTITFGDAISADTKLLVDNCSSGPGYHFDANTSSELVTAFDDIANQLNRLYLTN